MKIRIFQIIFILFLIEKIKAKENNESKILYDTITESYMRDFKIEDGVRRWEKTDLTWKISIFRHFYVSEMTQVKEISEAFKVWADVTPLEFSYSCQECESDFDIQFRYYDHGDDFPFEFNDTAHKDIAHSVYPLDGRIHFNAATHYDYNLTIVATHYIGHALGLDDSKDSNAIMFPEYFLTLRDNILDDDDIKRIQEIYGKKEVEQKTKTKSFSTKFSTTTPRPTSPGLTPCEGTLRAVFEGPSSVIYAALEYNENLYSFDASTNTWTENGDINEKFENIELEVKGGARCSKGYNYFFKDKRIWVYENFKLKEGFPMDFSTLDMYSYPGQIDAAIIENDEMFLFWGNVVFTFDIMWESENLTIHPKGHKAAESFFPNLPIWLEAAINYNSKVYFFKDHSFKVYTNDETEGRYIENDDENQSSSCPTFT